MRLIHTTTLELQDFIDTPPSKYAILSHCWRAGHEMLYQDYVSGNRDVDKMEKVRDCCQLAKDQGIEYAWIDTCCIDKTSSAELSEAINSMFSWYNGSAICFVFLSDMVATGNFERDMECFATDRWFTRGWTLQELIAPSDVRFYDHTLKPIGDKTKLAGHIHSITGIPESCLLWKDKLHLKDYSLARRMSWAANRETTRKEDMAYCLLGLFDVNIPLIYGEGTKAFQRLQHAIIAQSDDESIFAWHSHTGNETGMLATTPSEFAETGNIKPIYFERKRAPSTFTSRGLQVAYAYTNSGAMLQDRVTESLLGKELVDSLELRLDCELDGSQEKSSWIGIPLKRDPATGNWYRRDASKLFIAPQNGTFERVYPAPAGFKTIYVQAPSRDITNSSNDPRPRAYSKYSRPAWINVVYHLADALCCSYDLYLVAFLHWIFGLPPPNELLWWAYMTGIVFLTGGSFSSLLGCVILGLGGWEFANVMDRHNIITAVLSLAPMNLLQRFFDNMAWRDWGLKKS